MNKKKIIIICCAAVAIVGIIGGLLFRYISLYNSAYDVAFYSDDGTLLKTDSVKYKKSAEPPVQPEVVYGNIFQKWDLPVTAIKADCTFHPVCTSVAGKKNVFALSGAYACENGEAIVPFQLCGDVQLNGFDLIVNYDSEALELESVFNEDGDIVCNTEQNGKIAINFVSVGNTAGDVDICTFKFRIKSATEKTALHIDVNGVYAEDGEDITEAQYETVDSEIYIY